MGWNPQTLTDLSETILKAGLSIGPKLRFLDIGSQDVHLHSEGDKRQLNALIARLGGDAKKFPAQSVFPVRIFFEACGVDYWCIDIDERPKTVWLDLNSGQFPPRFRTSFDVVCNAGTTEHIANPVMALFAIHHLTKPGGLIFHDVPLNGFGNHGFLNYTPKFWHTTLWMNSYQLLHARIRKCDETLADINNFRPEHLNYFEGLSATKDTSFLIQIAYRKTTDHVFRPPLDMWPGMTRSQFQRCLQGALQGYTATGIVSEQEVKDSIAALLSTVGGLQ
jgi:SAM-dependent methyltransferase